MQVTLENPVSSPPQAGLSPEQRWSISLAVAQWLYSARAVEAAQQRLRALGVADGEILRRRRADSADSALAKLLYLAVTIIITHGRLEVRERRPAHLPPSVTLGAVVEAAADAYAQVLRSEIRGHGLPAPKIDMNVGDY